MTVDIAEDLGDDELRVAVVEEGGSYYVSSFYTAAELAALSREERTDPPLHRTSMPASARRDEHVGPMQQRRVHSRASDGCARLVDQRSEVEQLDQLARVVWRQLEA